MIPSRLHGLAVRSVVFLAVTATAFTALASVPSFAARDVVVNASNYGRATTVLGDSAVLWRPTYTASLRRKGPIDVIAYGKPAKRATFAGATYGKRIPSFTIAQKGAQTRWAATPVDHENQALVASVPIRIGDPGSKRVVRARVYANCAGEDRPTRRCTEADVARFGGTIVLLARTSVDGKPQATDIRLDSNGLSYRQLLRVARGLVPAG